MSTKLCCTCLLSCLWMAEASLAQSSSTLSQDTSVPARSPYHTLSLKNKTSRVLFVAIRYKARDGEWQTSGWYRLLPGKRTRPLRTENSVYYYYAESEDPKDKRLYWHGKSTPGMKNYRVNRSKTVYPFKRREITGKSWRDYEKGLTQRRT